MARSQQQKAWLVGGALAALVLSALGYFLFIGPQRSETADTNARADDARAQIGLLTGKLQTLQQQSANLASYRAAEAKARLALPAESGMSDFLRSLQAIGTTTQTTVSSLTVGAPTPLTPTAAAASSSSSSSSSSAGTTSAAATPSVYSLTITAQVSGTDANLSRFLDQLQSVQPRAVLITQIGKNSATAGTTSTAGPTLQLTMQAFVAPAR